MIRQAHSYLAGAVSGAALIAAAVVVFILLLASTQGFRDLPIVDIGGDESAAVDSARPAATGESSGTAASATAATRGGAGSDRSASTQGQNDLATGGAQGTVTSPTSSSPVRNGASSPSPDGVSTPGSSGSGSGSNSSGGRGSTGNSADSVSGTGVVDGVAGPDSVVGQTVDGTAGAVRDLLGAGR